MFIILLISLPPICTMPGWPISFTGTPPIVSTGISFADINGNGDLEVIFTFMFTPARLGTLFVYDYQGNELWKFSNDTILWYPAFADLDDDSVNEIVIGTSKGLYAFEGDGTIMPGFPFLIPGGERIEVSIADVNGDDSLDIIFFSDLRDINIKKAYLYVLDKHGTPLPGWPRIMPDYIFEHPAVADIDNDGTKEILYNTWLDSLYCFRYDGTVQPGFPVKGLCTTTTDCGPSEIILYDIDNDNYIEIISGSSTPWADTGCLFIYRWDGSNQLGWPKYFSDHIVFHPCQYHFAIGDIDNNQEIEFIIAGTGRPLRFLDQSGNYLPGSGKWHSGGAMNPLIANIDFTPEKEIIAQTNADRTTAFYYNGEMCYGWPIESPGGIEYWNSLTVDDVDNDGLIELGVIQASNIVYIWKLHGKPEEVEWGRPYYDLQRTCHFKR